VVLLWEDLVSLKEAVMAAIAQAINQQHIHQAVVVVLLVSAAKPSYKNFRFSYMHASFLHILF
jgi:hypothetical protein